MKWLPLLLLGTAVAGASEQGQEVTRIVFCTSSHGACADLRVFGATSRGRWGEIADPALIESKTPPPPVIYWTPEEYQRAVAGLGKQEGEQALLHRLAITLEHPETQVFDAVKNDLFRLASVPAYARSLDSLLDATAAIQGLDSRVRGLPPKERPSWAREHLAALMAALPQGPATAGYAQEAELLARLTAEVNGGPKEKALPPPFAEAEQVYLASAVSADMFRALVERGQHPYRWRGSLVTLLAPRDLHLPDRKSVV